jgi:hypothetical protein
MNHENKTFENQDVLLDGSSFTSCTFKRCAIIYRGTGKVQLKGNNFTDCQWRFDGEAGATLQYLAFMHAQGGEFRDIVENTFNSIRGQKPKGKTLH